MMYGNCYFHLQAALNREERAKLAAKIRRNHNIVAVTVDERKVHIWYKRQMTPFQLQEIQKMLIETVKRLQEAAITPAERLAEYRRDAVISLAGFAAMEVLKRTSPQLFVGTKIMRSLLVLGIARKFIHNGVSGVVKDHQPNADTLTATAVIASVLAGKPESSLTLLALSNGAEMLTSYAAEKARTHISGLLSLDQRYVWLVEGGTERKVPVEQVKVGDTIAAHTGEKIVVDGRVVSGDAAVNQASITGESNPAMKHADSPVYAGSVVEAGELIIKVEKVGKDTSLAHIVHLVEEAQNRKAPVQNFADKMANFLVPVSFIGAGIVYGATRDWQRVLNLLFIDFSCGLKLSTATAMSAAIGAAAKRGILVKGGNYIEALAETDTVVLDKTGTLTVGVPQIAFIKTAKGVEDKEMILLASSAEQHSVHPLAVAIQKYVEEQEWTSPQHKSSKTIVARGMQAEVPDFEGYKGGLIRVGSAKFLRENGIEDTEGMADGLAFKNLLYVARDKQLIGVIGIEDPIRPKMKKTLNQMRRHGVDEIVMLTGDSKAVAAEVAHSMDIDSYHAEILPEDKSHYVNKLKQRGTVMMVGDGINDAPALAFSDVGVSLGGRQTDIAAESSAVTIHSEDPERLIETLQLGRRTMDLVHQNFMATILVNSSAMLLGALGKISPLWAAVIHNTATLAVVLNSCRILNNNKSGFFARNRRAA
ncbi:putative cation transport ATPase [Selenomonas ruminantium subsp. lactilytica TAM6421]|uniref:Cd(2+)-exporting ATPase n=1 Tax=Selenomonas ruminantium subsp. lactilytica (strain NBRC 103574 / TAM6421) TaxID=927704 RepID=I0GMG0_SELRL|nr:heavy metal translocating P-type ATPase [Selenomonas ruminantium]BAL81947.1 putative cation transport ATPase [Selenomonas ruminantium subsp. lactilytica TAM6421]